MENHKELFIDDEIIRNNQKYAAVYARISSKTDNNSINAQIEQGKKFISDNNLLLYAVYSDQTSARTTSPEDRKGFSKLLSDAKKGLFKTVVIYRHDRIVRNLNHWIKIKNKLSILGIKICFSDNTEFTSDGSPEKDFLENLMVMVAELEPNSIGMRTANGRAFRRKQGILNSGYNPPFGYFRRPVAECDKGISGKSYFETNILESYLVIYFFKKYKSLIINEKLSIKEFKKNVLTFLRDIVDENIYLPDFINNPRLNKEEMDLLKKLDEKSPYLLDSDVFYGINQAIKHFDKIDKWGQFFSRSIYGGFLLLDAKDKTNGIIEGSMKMNKDAFVPLSNGKGVVAFELWQEVYCHYHTYLSKEKYEPNFLFDNLLYCNCSRKLKLKDGLLQCDNFRIRKTCKAYSKMNLIIAILDLILNETLLRIYKGYKSSNHAGGLQTFKQNIEERVSLIDSQVINYRKLKLKTVETLIKYNDISSINKVKNYHDQINSLIFKGSMLRNELDAIETLANKLQEAVYDNQLKNSNELSFIKQNLIVYIVKNESTFMPIFNKIIGSIKIKNIEDCNHLRSAINIEYKFRPKKGGDLSKGIN